MSDTLLARAQYACFLPFFFFWLRVWLPGRWHFFDAKSRLRLPQRADFVNFSGFIYQCSSYLDNLLRLRPQTFFSALMDNVLLRLTHFLMCRHFKISVLEGCTQFLLHSKPECSCCRPADCSSHVTVFTSPVYKTHMLSHM